MAENQGKSGSHQKSVHPHGADGPTRDELLLNEVKESLLHHTESAGIDVQVSGGKGQIRLFGVVDVLSHKRAAEQIAKQIPGVHRIENEITVANEETASDKDLLQAVTGKLTANRELMEIGCRVHRGVVTLVGHAASYADVNDAIQMVEGMSGVREVRVERVKVGEGDKADDADLSRAAERLLDRMGYDHQTFTVYSDAGVLFVKGFVPTRSDRSRIKTAMHTLAGMARLEALLITADQEGGEIH